MKKASPAPISTNLSAEGGATNLPWSIWLRETGELLVNATRTVVHGQVSSTTIGQICFMSVNATFANGKIKLPYNALVSKKIQAFVDGASTPTYFDLNAGDSELTVTANVQVVISDWFMAQLS